MATKKTTGLIAVILLVLILIIIIIAFGVNYYDINTKDGALAIIGGAVGALFGVIIQVAASFNK